MKEIPLTKGYVAIVDDEDYGRMSQYKWQASVRSNTLVYAIGNARTSSGRRTRVYLHRMVMGAEKGQQVDHINRNGLDCQRHNLRFSTHGQNMANSKNRNNRGRKYRGVYLYASGWYAVLMANKVYYTEGPFNDEVEAASARDVLAVKHHGEFAALNFPRVSKIHP